MFIVVIAIASSSPSTCNYGVPINISHVSLKSQLDIELIAKATPLMKSLYQTHISLMEHYQVGLQVDTIQHIQLDNHPDACKQGQRSDDFKRGIHFQLISDNESCIPNHTMGCGEYSLTYNLSIDVVV